MASYLKYKINPKNRTLTIQEIINNIKKGFELQKLNNETLTDKQILDYNDSIIISPEYQREYRSNKKDESSLIESLILDIPIPPIFLANTLYKQVQVLNVIDGQHRLKAFYRFMTNQYNLTDLPILKEFNGQNFENLDLTLKADLQSKEVSAIVFKDFPGLEFEVEIFNRYNKGTKPLSPQEIRHAIFNSKYNGYINTFSKELKEGESSLKNAYNITDDRILKRKVQESLFVILNILDSGINVNISKSPEYAEKFMEEKAKLFKEDPESFEEEFDTIIEKFKNFNKFIETLCNQVEYPFSKELYGISNRNYKFQISLAMILSGLFFKINNSEKDINDINVLLFFKKMNEILNDSFLEDPNYSASSTNSKEIKKLIDNINLNNFFD